MKKILTVLLAVMCCFIMTVPTFAYSFNGVELPAFTSQYQDTHPYAYINTFNGVYNLRLCSSPVEENDDAISWTTAGTYHYYQYKDGAWTPFIEEGYEHAYNAGSNLLNKPYAKNLVWASTDVYVKGTYDVYLEGDENFLTPPLAEVVQKVTAEEMVVTLQEVVGTMKVLVLCGVGLMASLVVLSLFGKRSLIFRG